MIAQPVRATPYTLETDRAELVHLTRTMHPEVKAAFLYTEAGVRAWYCPEHGAMCVPSLSEPGTHRPIDYLMAEATSAGGVTRVTRAPVCLTCPATTSRCWHVEIHKLCLDGYAPVMAEDDFPEPITIAHRKSQVLRGDR